MLKTLGAQIKEFKRASHCHTDLYDSGSGDGDDHSAFDGFHY